MHCVLVSHTHWDREWYRTFEEFRSRLVDAVDDVLDRVAADPSFRFLLDGQTILLEDYLQLRPERSAELQAACRAGRVSIGPWYVQPDSLLPSGEALVRNLLEGRRVGRELGGVSRVAYTPDSFGHPAQLPQILAGFGLEPFVYWRGNGNEIDQLPAEYRWEAPDGTSILVHHLSEGYFAAAGLPEDPMSAALFLERLATKLGQRTRNGRVLLMNGIDHALPDPGVTHALEALARVTGWQVERGLLEDFVRGLAAEAPVFRGALLGGRVANLLPGVWSTRMMQKLRNRRAEALLTGWAEPYSALAHLLGAPDERPALRTAWRALLPNQAHDSICGCSQDRVHLQMEGRYDQAIELSRETTRRVLERLAGLGGSRRRPWAADLDVAVFNPSPHTRTDAVQIPLDPDPWLAFRGEYERSMQVHPLLGATALVAGYTADGAPAHLIRDEDSPGVRVDPASPPLVVELVARDVPGFGWRRVRLARSAEHSAIEDDGTEIAANGIAVHAAPEGTLRVRFGAREFRDLLALEDTGDRGDTYDFDPVTTGGELRVERVRTRRWVHPAGIARLLVERELSMPAALASDRTRRSDERISCRFLVEARLVEGVSRVDLDVRLENAARDHRLRLLFPTQGGEVQAASTFDVIRRPAGPPNANGWVHPPPATFPLQGFVSVGGLCVGAPGMPEAEVSADGVIAIPLVRAVGSLAYMDLHTRPVPAGPVIPTPGAQCLGPIRARLALLDALDPRAIRDFELGLMGVLAGSEPLVAPNVPLLEISPHEVLLEACKPPEEGRGMVIRLLNPTDAPLEARVRPGVPFAVARLVRLDESLVPGEVLLEQGWICLTVPPHALRSILVA
jgi:alpha-mannosidase